MESIVPDSTLESLLRLPSEKKIELIGDLWDSIPAAEVPVPEWHREEVRRRVAEAKADPSSVISEEEFWRQVDGDNRATS